MFLPPKFTHMHVYIGADHAGYKLKDQVKDLVEEMGNDVVDLGTFSEDSVDYPDIAREVAEKVYENPGSLGVLICGSGTGMCMAANKHVGIRAASCDSVYLAEYARKHNDANILCMGERVLETVENAKPIIEAFLTTDFEGGRHQRRVDKINAMDN
jgi:ribose 5-phosphate isomerase B